MEFVNPTKGAKIAAEIITGHNALDISVTLQPLTNTAYGKKSAMGIARIIDNETYASPMLEVLQETTQGLKQFVEWMQHSGEGNSDGARHYSKIVKRAEAIIDKAKP